MPFRGSNPLASAKHLLCRAISYGK